MVKLSTLRFVSFSLRGVTRFSGITCNGKRNISISHVAMEESKGSCIDGSGDEWEHPIYASDRIKEKKSVFLAHATTLQTSSALPGFIAHITSLSALKKATHCMYAYRLLADPLKPSIKIIGQNDGGEKGSGERLSRLLEALVCENVIVVVSRWYGGVRLGSDRWKLISTVAKEALYKGNFVKEAPRDSTIATSHKTKTRKKK